MLNVIQYDKSETCVDIDLLSVWMQRTAMDFSSFALLSGNNDFLSGYLDLTKIVFS